MFGHVTAVITLEVYAYLVDDELDRAADRIGEIDGGHTEDTETPDAAGLLPVLVRLNRIGLPFDPGRTHKQPKPRFSQIHAELCFRVGPEFATSLQTGRSDTALTPH